MKPKRHAVGTIQAIAVDKIRPFKNQPRKYFDEKSLKELADSIADQGQITPAWVIPVYDDKIIEYELIAGERRLRACKLANISTLLCEIREPGTAEAQYLASVMENMGRKDCTLLETAYAVENVYQLFKKEKVGNQRRKNGIDLHELTAKVFAKSPAWVMQYRRLTTLHPEVQKLMSPEVPEEKRLRMAVAMSLTSLQPEMQVRLAKEIVRQGLKHTAAMRYLQGQIAPEMLTSKAKLRRGIRDYNQPYNVHKRLVKHLTKLSESAQILDTLASSHLDPVFANRLSDLETVIAMIDKREGQLHDLQCKLLRLRNELQVRR